MNDIDAIIFDLDGVICSTDRYHYLAWKALADSLGIPFDEQVNSQLRGVSRMESLEIIMGSRSGEYSESEKLALAEKKNSPSSSVRLTPSRATSTSSKTKTAAISSVFVRRLSVSNFVAKK